MPIIKFSSLAKPFLFYLHVFVFKLGACIFICAFSFSTRVFFLICAVFFLLACFLFCTAFFLSVHVFFTCSVSLAGHRMKMTFKCQLFIRENDQ